MKKQQVDGFLIKKKYSDFHSQSFHQVLLEVIFSYFSIFFSSAFSWGVGFFDKVQNKFQTHFNLKYSAMFPSQPFYFVASNITQWNQYQTLINPLFLQYGNPLTFTEQVQNSERSSNYLNSPGENTLSSQEPNPGEKKSRVKESKNSRNRNLCSLILKDFLKKIQKNPVVLFEILRAKKSQYLVKNFLSEIKEIFPQQPAYIKPSFIKQICLNKERGEFTELFRLVLRHFLLNQYPRMVLEKKKKKLNHLKECRILYEKIFSDR